ncbi:alpha/beta fold hydrolase [Jiangella anatolica]|uniref:AB hydrolase-1 domain-containing protein n=1 Tax=Jiangella anatolica TaxID=2670374 RepID=A0A2W2C4F9_9ACTN|nr:alpha/beta fold hydrolase [Jiangella anatolica]PZF80636.1 hypothetical protein C1I92_24910 [Jiangella anatolica]
MDLAVRTTGAGDGPPVLLIHGGAEDAELLTPQATAIARLGRRVIWYDRRGTGGSTRAGWPAAPAAAPTGADARPHTYDAAVQHADDAAAVLRMHADEPAHVIGFSSGGIVALALAALHPELVADAVAWEAPAVTALPGGAELHAAMMAPVTDHLRDHPADWAGAYHVMLAVISNGAADLADPMVARTTVNAEAIVRDDGPLITAHVFAPGELPADRVTIAVGEATDPMHSAIAEAIAALAGTPVTVVPGVTDHEVYLHEPEVLADWLATAQRNQPAAPALDETARLTTAGRAGTTTTTTEVRRR